MSLLSQVKHRFSSSFTHFYDVYRHPKTRKLQAVKQGFCWPACFFQSLWAFSRRLYLLGILLGGAFVVLVIAEVALESKGGMLTSIVGMIQAGFYILIGWFANDVRRWFLDFKGFQKEVTVSAKWPSFAIRQYIESESQPVALAQADVGLTVLPK